RGLPSEPSTLSEACRTNRAIAPCRGCRAPFGRRPLADNDGMIDVEAMIRDAGAAGGVTGAIFDLIGGDPHRPRLVWYGSGRTELSGASLMNWSAKTAGL